VVTNAALVVGLTDGPSRAWVRRFRGALTVLDRSLGDWGAITLSRGAITSRV
jgi:hypothetical protein